MISGIEPVYCMLAGAVFLVAVWAFLFLSACRAGTSQEDNQRNFYRTMEQYPKDLGDE